MRIVRTLGIAATILGMLACTHPLLSAESASKTVQVTATILPRLELTITPETGPTIAFGAIEQPAAGATNERDVRVNVGVFSNLGYPYHVSQLIRRSLTNQNGQTMDDTQFRVAAREASLGTAAVPEPTPIVPGTPTTLYFSNAQGKSDNFLADYSLSITPETSAGDYATEIVYTVTSL